MRITRLLIANRGEIAIRIAQAAAELGIHTVALFTADDARSLHVRRADEAIELPGQGVAGYLDMDAIIDLARQKVCDAVHPGYGLLSENADFARRCEAADLLFVGPAPEVLAQLGDKAQARQLACDHQVPILAGTGKGTTLAQAEQFRREQGSGQPLVIKACAGGGGRGMRVVRPGDDLAEAYARCQSEARAAFANDDLYLEAFMPAARHVEVQIIGDGSGAISHLWERDCTLQRRHQKVVEIAPAPGLPAGLREPLLDAAVTLARSLRYRGVGTFEFLVSATDEAADFRFLEANPRIQVEHTVTEEITGIDLVQAQLRLAAGATLAELGLDQERIPAPRGIALQARILLESLGRDGQARPASGILSAYEPPSGPGLRVDGCGYAGYTTHPGFDSLVAKLVVRGADLTQVLQRSVRALDDFRLEGVANNLVFLKQLLQHPALADYHIDTDFIARHARDLSTAPVVAAERHFPSEPVPAQNEPPVLTPRGTLPVSAPHSGRLIGLEVGVGDPVSAGQPVAVLEAMKMEFVVRAEQAGRVHSLACTLGDSVSERQPLLFLDADSGLGQHEEDHQTIDLGLIRDDLAEVLDRHARLLDSARPDAVTRRRRTGQRTIRENLADLIDPGSFIEYGGLALAAQRRRFKVEKLIETSPADGLVTGLGTIDAGTYGAEAARCLFLGYDYTVFAGTQGVMNHKKTDRLLHLAQQWQLPVVFYAEGGGGRPSDTDLPGVAMLDNMTFLGMARLSGLVPLVGVVSGRCFAGNAALLGCCDVIIATENTSLGMAGPAMIEGGGLGRFTPEDVGPVSVQAPNGVVDIVVANEAEATRVARQYLGYFQGTRPDWDCGDQRLLRHLIPENRRRAYAMREVIGALVDTDSVLELRQAFAPALITALVRIEGRPFGLIANDPQVLGGAIDAAAGDKAARFLQLCDAFDLPLISLCDTPGFMVGPDAEREATVRHVSRMFVTAASLSVPFFTIVTRRGYGLGAQAMAAGSFHAPLFTIAWPSSEFGPMGLEGAVRLAMGKQLDAIEDPDARQRRFEALVAMAYEQGKGLNMASYLEIDDVIDPAETRRWLIRGLDSVPRPRRQGRKRPFIDPW